MAGESVQSRIGVLRAMILGLVVATASLLLALVLGWSSSAAHADDRESEGGLLSGVARGVGGTLGAVTDTASATVGGVKDAVSSTVTTVTNVVTPPAPAPAPAPPAPAEPAPAPAPADPAPAAPAHPAAPQPAAPQSQPADVDHTPASPAGDVAPAHSAPAEPSAPAEQAPAPAEGAAPAAGDASTAAPKAGLLPLRLPSNLVTSVVDRTVAPLTDTLSSVPVVGTVLDRTHLVPVIDRTAATVDTVVDKTLGTVRDIGTGVGLPPLVETSPLPPAPAWPGLPPLIPEPGSPDQGSSVPPPVSGLVPGSGGSSSPGTSAPAPANAPGGSAAGVAAAVGSHGLTQSDPAPVFAVYTAAAVGADERSTGSVPVEQPGSPLQGFPASMPVMPTSSISSTTSGVLGVAVVAAGMFAALRAWKRPFLRSSAALPGAPVLGVDISPD